MPGRVVPGGREPDGTGHAAANLGMLRRVALSLLKRTGTKGSIRTRRMRAGWDDEYLLKVLNTLATDK